MSSVNGGMVPDNTAARERPNRIQVARTIDVFAPRKNIKTISKITFTIRTIQKHKDEA